jgi:para-nitrobenzyl esterase
LTGKLVGETVGAANDLEGSTMNRTQNSASRGRLRAAAAAVVAAGALVVASAGSAAGAGGDAAVVRTDSGPVRGTVTSDVRSFQGIPFAAPPVGELRWRPPQPPQRWTEPRDATAPADRCAQPQNIGPASESEDCLYLNVTTPRTPGRAKPVMVWLHGGGNVYGSGVDYDPRRLAVRGDVVVVTINYRLGVFGFLGHPRLADSGAFGLQDQQAALRWVRHNAAAFGGDPRNVTLFGQSGGAYDVCAQLTSPAARGLFERVIMESGTCSMTWPRNGVNPGISAGSPWQPLSEAQAEGVTLATGLGCADQRSQVDCLRQVPVPQLLAATQTADLPAVAYGNQTLPANPVTALAEGRFTHVPVISGTNRDEQRLATAFLPQAFTEEGYQQLLVDAFGDKAPLVAARYPSAELGSSALAWAAVATDRVWSCAQVADQRRFARWAPTYGYEFADRSAPTLFPFPEGLPAGAYHGAEMAYLFDLNGSATSFTPSQQALADQMIRYWSQFAATGDPNGDGSPTWTRAHDSTAQSLAPGNITPVNIADEHQCAFWSTIT